MLKVPLIFLCCLTPYTAPICYHKRTRGQSSPEGSRSEASEVSEVIDSSLCSYIFLLVSEIET